MIDRGCPEWLEGVSAYLDGALSPDEEQAVHQHLRGCAGCAELLVDLVPMVQTLRSLPPPAPVRDLWPALSAELKGDPAFQANPPTRRADRNAWGKPLMGLVAAGFAVLATGALTVYGYREAAPGVPVARTETYWRAHAGFGREAAMPMQLGPAADEVEASQLLGR